MGATVRLIVLGILFIGGGVALFWLGRDALNIDTGPQEGIVEIDSSRLVPVYVAARDLPRGTRVEEDDLFEVTMLDGLGSIAPRRPESIVGRVVTTDIPEGQILLGDILSLNPADAGLAPLIPVGQRAFSLRVDESIAAGDFLRPGDRVDVLIVLESDAISEVDPFSRSRGDEAVTLLQNVTVLTVGSTLENQQGNDDGDRTRVRTVSIAVEPEDGDLLALARELGDYAIALRNPADESVGTRTAVTAVDLRARLLGLDPQTLLVAADQPAGLDSLFGAGFDVTGDQPPQPGDGQEAADGTVGGDTASGADGESLQYLVDPSAPIAQAMDERPRLPDTVRPVVECTLPEEVEETPVQTLPADQQNMLLEALTVLLTPDPTPTAVPESPAPEPVALSCPEPAVPTIRTITIRAGTNASTQTIEQLAIEQSMNGQTTSDQMAPAADTADPASGGPVVPSDNASPLPAEGAQ